MAQWFGLSLALNSSVNMGFLCKTAQRRLLHISALWSLCLCPSVSGIYFCSPTEWRHHKSSNFQTQVYYVCCNVQRLLEGGGGGGGGGGSQYEGFFYCKGLATESSTCHSSRTQRTERPYFFAL